MAKTFSELHFDAFTHTFISISLTTKATTATAAHSGICTYYSEAHNLATTTTITHVHNTNRKQNKLVPQWLPDNATRNVAGNLLHWRQGKRVGDEGDGRE